MCGPTRFEKKKHDTLAAQRHDFQGSKLLRHAGSVQSRIAVQTTQLSLRSENFDTARGPRAVLPCRTKIKALMHVACLNFASQVAYTTHTQRHQPNKLRTSRSLCVASLARRQESSSSSVARCDELRTLTLAYEQRQQLREVVSRIQAAQQR